MTAAAPSPAPRTVRLTTFVGALVAVAVLAASLLVVVDRRRAPDEDVADRPVPAAPAAGSAAVVLQTPTALVAGSGERVRASTLADGEVDAIELWVDGAPVDAVDGSDGDGAAWDWDPEPGSHLVVARAVAGGEVVGESAPSWVEVTDPAEEPGDDADAGGGDAPSPGPDGPVAIDGCEVVATAPAGGAARLRVSWPGTGRFHTAVEGDGGSRLAMTAPAGPFAAYLEGPDGATPPQQLVLPPDCATTAWSGDVHLDDGWLVLDDPDAADAPTAYAYLSVDGGPAVRIPADDHTAVPRGPRGYDLRGLVPPVHGSTVVVEAWGRVGEGAVPLGSGQLTLGAADLSPLESSAAIDAALAAAQRTDLDWIQQRYQEAGSCELCFEQPEILSRTGVLADDGTTIGVSAELSPSGIGTGELDFRWSSIDPSVTHVVWQVSAGPMPGAPLLDFPGLLATQAVGGATGEVTIDIDAIWYPEPEATTASIGDLSLGDLTAAAQPVADALGGPAATPPPSAEPTTSTLFVDPDLVAAFASLGPRSAWVRVVPFAGTQPLATASNPVVFSIDPAEGFQLAPSPPGLPPIEVASIEADFVPPHEPNPTYGRCVRILENPHGSANPPPVPTAKPLYDEFAPAPPGATRCAKYDPPSQSWFDAVISSIAYVASLWDGAVELLGELKEKVVEIAAQLGCAQLAKSHWDELPQDTKDLLISQGIDSPTKLCEKMIGTAIDVYLTANGIPPTLPTSEDLADAAKGELANLIAKKASELCPDVVTEECREQAEAIVNEVLDRMQEEVSASAMQAANAGDWYLVLDPDIVVMPEPAGQFQPAHIRVDLTLSAPAPDDRTCGFLGQVRGTHPSWTYIEPQSASTSAIVTKAITGPVMVPVSTSVTFRAGETTATGVIVMPDLNRTWHPTPADHWNSDPFWWAWFDQDATLTMQLSGGCPGSDQQAVQLTQSFGPIEPVDSPAEVVLP